MCNFMYHDKWKITEVYEKTVPYEERESYRKKRREKKKQEWMQQEYHKYNDEPIHFMFIKGGK